MKRMQIVVWGLCLVFIAIGMSQLVLSEPKFRIQDASDVLVAWINQSGVLNISGDLECSSCINPEDVNDIDDAQIETDLNTYVDIPGDIMTGNLSIGSNNLTVEGYICGNSTCEVYIHYNGTAWIIQS